MEIDLTAGRISYTHADAMRLFMCHHYGPNGHDIA
jgi:hypothetical protein